MATWDSADLLARVKRYMNRPNPDNAVADADYYAFLLEAEYEWMGILAIHSPESQYGAPVQLTTSDGGATYQFPAGVFPIGHLEIRSARNGLLLAPCSDFDDGDFVPEGTQIRMPNGTTRTFSSGPWARYVTLPTALDAGNQPILNPPHARILLVFRACYKAAARLNQDPGRWLALEQIAAWGDPTTGTVGLIAELKTQYYGEGATSTGATNYGGQFYRGPDFRGG